MTVKYSYFFWWLSITGTATVSPSDWVTDTISNLNKDVSIRFSTSFAGEAPLERSVRVVPSASATFGPRLPARSLLRGRLRNCLIHCVVLVFLIAIHANCFGKHSNACLVISDCFGYFRMSNTFFRVYFQNWKKSALLIEVWFLFLSCVCIDSWLPSLLDNSAEIFLKYLEIWNPGRFQTGCIIENAPLKIGLPIPLNIRAICFSKLYCFISFWRR